MKFLVTSLLSVFAFSVFAQEGSFSTIKQQKLDHLDQKIQLMNDSRNCIVGASDKTALDSCYDDMKEQKEELKEEHKMQKEEFEKDSKEDEKNE